jgi:hypothetical protein
MIARLTILLLFLQGIAAIYQDQIGKFEWYDILLRRTRLRFQAQETDWEAERVDNERKWRESVCID